jgi:O-antigen/teichoic acid export membrane protein
VLSAPYSALLSAKVEGVNMADGDRRRGASIRDLASLAVGQGASRGLSFVTFVLLSRWMTPQEFGHLNVAYAVAASLSQAPTSVDSAVVTLTHAPDVDRKGLLYAYRGVAVGFFLLCFATGLSIWSLSDASAYLGPVGLGVIYAGLFNAYTNLPTLHQAAGRFLKSSLILAAAPAVLLLVTVGLFQGPYPSATAAQTLAWWNLALLPPSIVSLAAVGGSLRPPASTRQAARRLGRFSGWLVIATVLFAVSLRMELYLVAGRLSPADVGVYAVSVRYSALAELLTAAFAAYAVQRVASTDGARESTSLAGLRAPFGLVLVGVLGIAAVTPVALPFLFGATYQASVPAAAVLVGAQLVLLPATLTMALLYRSEATKVVALSTVLMIIVKLAVTTPLMGQMGLAGAAVSHLLASATMATALLVGYRRTRMTP